MDFAEGGGRGRGRRRIIPGPSIPRSSRRLVGSEETLQERLKGQQNEVITPSDFGAMSRQDETENTAEANEEICVLRAGHVGVDMGSTDGDRR